MSRILFAALGFLLGSIFYAFAQTYPALRPDVFISLPWSWTGSQTFGQTQGGDYAPSLTANNYTLQASDCGKTLWMPAGTSGPTVTLLSLNQTCTIGVEQASGSNQYTVTNGSGATFNSVNSYTKTKGQYAVIFLRIDVPSGSAAHWILSGDGA